MWSEVTKTESGGARLHDLIAAGSPEPAIWQVIADRGAKPARYFFLEAEINQFGYQFMQEGKLQQAISILKANVELFPRSWNVYDSLAEAYLKAGTTTMRSSSTGSPSRSIPTTRTGRTPCAAFEARDGRTVRRFRPCSIRRGPLSYDSRESSRGATILGSRSSRGRRAAAARKRRAPQASSRLRRDFIGAERRLLAWTAPASAPRRAAAFRTGSPRPQPREPRRPARSRQPGRCSS